MLVIFRIEPCTQPKVTYEPPIVLKISNMMFMGEVRKSFTLGKVRKKIKKISSEVLCGLFYS